MIAKTARELQALAGWDQYEASKQPKDYTIANIAEKEIARLQEAQNILAENFRSYATDFIGQFESQLPDYGLQHLRVIRDQVLDMTTRAKEYKQKDLAQKLEQLHDAIIKYESLDE